ncbi:Succinate--hydroxymethylglutarate CoA-transferase [Hondaea fermentalgiana]|uniref:Succinate--hydroxymethylglutarate CoA-transferase n=1 Tax=Hondaea fermentalgiana TaxID=2315210 RepID=A0A2R5GIK9_9STRA|nr:Succinate--hydroxymethylglutarate CoA-transferase [Hondaea fermentalgiana]|eukprot:GBG30727.1 Succinate--hydroxymethylglutarate CoA-transferase [Hondaea fermentalgiana]
MHQGRRSALGGAASALEEILACTGLERGVFATKVDVETPRVDQGGIDVACAAIRQERYMKINGEAIKTWDPISGLYCTGDARHIQLHCNFPHHRKLALEVLGIDESASVTREEVETAMAREKDVFDLEDRLFQAGACAAAVRTPEEWDAHPQQAAIAELPLIEFETVECKHEDIKQAAQARLDAWMERRDPHAASASGLRCLDLTRVLAGPIAGRSMADLGASVMRVSGPGRPYIPMLSILTGPGKQTCEIDLETKQGRESLEELLKTTDVFFNAYRRGSLTKHGLDSASIAARHPGIIVIEIDAYSRKGPWAGKRGFDSLVQCASGLAHAHSVALGQRETVSHLPVQLLDYVTGYLATFAGITARLDQVATQDPSSRIVRLSLARTAQWLRDQGVKDAGQAWEMAQDVPASMIESEFVERTTPDGAKATILGFPWTTEPASKAGLGHVIEAIGSGPARWL